MTLSPSTLPTPRDALFSAIELWTSGDRDAARFWLDVARELREGTASVRLDADVQRWINAPTPYAEGVRVDSTGLPITETQAIPAQQDATIRINPVTDSAGECPACGLNTFMLNGKVIHRASYRTECSPSFTVSQQGAASFVEGFKSNVGGNGAR